MDIKPFSNREIYHLLSSVRLFAFTMSFLFRLTKQGRKHLLLPSLFQLSSSPKQLLKSTYGKSCKQDQTEQELETARVFSWVGESNHGLWLLWLYSLENDIHDDSQMEILILTPHASDFSWLEDENHFV